MDMSKKYQILALDALQELKEGKPTSSVNPVWSSMDEDQKELFASTLLEEAKHLILKGHDFAFNVFDLLRRITPSNAKIHFKQGVFLFDYGVHKNGEKYLISAQKYIRNALELKNKSVDAWAIWGDILVHLGLMKDDMSYFQQANEKYEKAYGIAQDKPKYLKKFLWDWALSCYFLGKHSGEAVDIKNSIDLFEKASVIGCSQESFWRDFGNAYVAMGLLIADKRFLTKALSCFQKAIQIKPTYYKGWHSTANTFQKLYELTWNEDYLSQAHSAYGKAADLERDHHELWIHWGHLFLLSGVAKEEVKHLQMAAVKFEKALELSPNHLEALSSLAESYAALGTATSDLEYLKKSKVQIFHVCEEKKDNEIFLTRKAYCLYMHGQYFDDTANYLEAIECYKKAHEINPRHFKALLGLGQCYLALGNQSDDENQFILAHEYFRKASDVNGNYPEVWNLWGMTHLRLAELLDDQENITQAVEKFERALAFYGNQNPPALLLFNYGCSLDFLGNYSDDPLDYEKAIKVLNLLIQTYPHFSCAHYNLALVYSHLGEMQSDIDLYSKAIESFYKAAQDDPEDASICISWAITLMDYAMLINEPLKRDFFSALMDEAEKKLRKALLLGATEAYFQLSCLFSLKGNVEEALHFLQVCRSKGILPDIEELNFDPRLEAIRAFDPYHEFIDSTPIKERFEDN